MFYKNEKERAGIWETKIKDLLDQKEKRKFDISSPVGIIVGFAIVIAAIMLGGGGIKALKTFRCFIYFNCYRGNNSDNCCGISIWRNKKYTKSIFTVLHRKEEDLEQLTDLFVDFSKSLKTRFAFFRS